jgi:hypothetical protein
MRETTSSDSISGRPQKSGKFGLLIVVIAVAHVVLFFAPNLYLPFDLNDLFLLAYGLVTADSALVAFFGITLLRRALFSSVEGNNPR